MAHLKFKKNIQVLQDSPVPLSYCICLLPDLFGTQRPTAGDHSERSSFDFDRFAIAVFNGRGTKSGAKSSNPNEIPSFFNFIFIKQFSNGP
ncbi:hypothetical protein L6452_17402 [Arctium lappa]|uniref:Uncharacterized protein n=1 Tax=Arctium lappa TaxID=4217 RepID=A0ACB9C3G1_ARCLA|nr:hypothetical protein L6452_17402 [Arctium lappa]